VPPSRRGTVAAIVAGCLSCWSGTATAVSARGLTAARSVTAAHRAIDERQLHPPEDNLHDVACTDIAGLGLRRPWRLEGAIDPLDEARSTIGQGTMMTEDSGNLGREHISDELSIRGRNVVAAIDFHRTRLYPTNATPGQSPELVTDVDPQGHAREISHKAGNPHGTYEAGNPDYWREITEALRPAGAILVLSHGNGKANASHQWVAYIEEHAKDVAAKVVADVRADIDDLTNEQVLLLAQHYFGINPMRYRGRDPGTVHR
jgi:hypothetical protein